MVKLIDLFKPEELKALRARAKEFSNGVSEHGTAKEVSGILEAGKDYPGDLRSVGEGYDEGCPATRASGTEDQ